MPARHGQHFLANKAAIQTILGSLDLKSSDHVLEIGPGKGALTTGLMEKAGHITAVEIDAKLAEVLTTQFAKRPQFTLIQKDFLDFHLDSLSPASSHWKIVGNLPYQLTSPILRKLSSWTSWDRATVMVQKEVGERLCAQVGTAEYGALTVGMSLVATCSKILELSEGSFRPPPRIKSLVVQFLRRQEPLTSLEKETQRVIQAAFQQRRKIILNALSHGLNVTKDKVGEWLEKEGISHQDRAENLAPLQFVKIAEHYNKDQDR